MPDAERSERSTDRSEAVTAPARRQRQSFTEFVQEVNDGALVDELTDRLRDLVANMHQQAQGSGGKPKGQLRVAFDLKLDRGVFEVETDIAVKMPKTVRGRTIMYGTPDGRLSQQNPSQLDLSLAAKDVSTTGAGSVRALPIR